jgi:hypothetical protein
MKAVDLRVIGRVADDEDVLGRHHAGEPIEKARCSHATCEHDHRDAVHY